MLEPDLLQIGRPPWQGFLPGGLGGRGLPRARPKAGPFKKTVLIYYRPRTSREWGCFGVVGLNRHAENRRGVGPAV